jgi:hypothetical protein
MMVPINVSTNKLKITNTSHAVMAAIAGSHIADTSVIIDAPSLDPALGADVGVGASSPPTPFNEKAFANNITQMTTSLISRGSEWGRS